MTLMVWFNVFMCNVCSGCSFGQQLLLLGRLCSLGWFLCRGLSLRIVFLIV